MAIFRRREARLNLIEIGGRNRESSGRGASCCQRFVGALFCTARALFALAQAIGHAFVDASSGHGSHDR